MKQQNFFYQHIAIPRTLLRSGAAVHSTKLLWYVDRYAMWSV